MSQELRPRLTPAQTYLASFLCGVGCFAALMWASPTRSVWGTLGWSLLAAYVPSYFDGTESTVQGRYWPAFTKLSFWRYFHKYHSVRHIFTAQTDPECQYIITSHPHGTLSLHHWTYVTGPEFQARFPGARRRHVGSSLVFHIPLYRDFMLWGGLVDAPAPVARAVLRAGFTLLSLLGGIAEQTRTDPARHLVIVMTRPGIFRLSLQHGVPIVPAYCFGENALMSVSRVGATARAQLSDRWRVPLCIAWGRWGLPLPHRVPLTAVFGAPLEVGAPIEKPTHEDIAALQQRYAAELQRIFNLYKREAGYPDAELEIQ